MIKVICFSNLDLFNELWPNELPNRPIIGDYIQSQVIHKGGNLILKIVAITWKYGMGYWYLEIELHDRRERSIQEFYEWYAPFVGKSVGYFI